jgi:hypothetical protein
MENFIKIIYSLAQDGLTDEKKENQEFLSSYFDLRVIFDLNTSRYHVILYPLGGGWWFEDSR